MERPIITGDIGRVGTARNRDTDFITLTMSSTAPTGSFRALVAIGSADSAASFAERTRKPEASATAVPRNAAVSIGAGTGSGGIGPRSWSSGLRSITVAPSIMAPCPSAIA